MPLLSRAVEGRGGEVVSEVGSQERPLRNFKVVGAVALVDLGVGEVMLEPHEGQFRDEEGVNLGVIATPVGGVDGGSQSLLVWRCWLQ